MKLSAKNECRALIIIGVIFFAGGCLAVRPAWRSYPFRNSVQVTAHILELGIKTGRKSSSTTALYLYTYEGVEYSSTSVSPTADRGRIYRQLKGASKTMAYIDPRNPGRSYLDPVLPPIDLCASIGFGILFPLVGSSVTILGIKRRRALPASRKKREAIRDS